MPASCSRAALQQYVSTRPLTVVQPSLVNLPSQVAQPGSVYTVQQQVNWQAHRAAVMLMRASASEEVHRDTSISRLQVDPNKTVCIGVAADLNKLSASQNLRLLPLHPVLRLWQAWQASLVTGPPLLSLVVSAVLLAGILTPWYPAKRLSCV